MTAKRAKSKRRTVRPRAARRGNSSARAATRWKPSVSSEALAAKTGRSWAQWLPIIDREGGRTIGHTAIAAMLVDKYGVPGWWAQTVTVGYEQARGLRALHEKPGGFEIGSTRMIAAGVSEVFDAFLDPRKRARWLPETLLTIHRSTPYKSLRATWTDGTRSISVLFDARGSEKTQVALQHGKLANAAAARRMKVFWGTRLDALRESLEG